MTRIEELKQELKNKLDEIKNLTGKEKVKKFEEIKALQSDIEIEEQLNQVNIDPTPAPVPAEPKNKVSLIHAMVKQVKGMPLNNEERIAIDNAVTGEDNIHIKELSIQIRELLRDKDYLKDLVTVHKTRAISGQFPVNKTEKQGLVPVVDGVDMVADTDLKFEVIKFTISKYGKLGMLTDTVLKYTEADLIKYVAQVFVDAYVYKINDMICEKLIGTFGNRNAGQKAVNTVKELVSATRLGLNNALKQNGAEILMTPETFDFFAKQENQQLELSWVQPDLTKPAEPYFNGYHVRLVDSLHLKSGLVQAGQEIDPAGGGAGADADRHFFVFGNFKQSLMLFENEEYSISMSKEAGFLKNVVYSKIITYFDLEVFDDEAWEVYYTDITR